jgi:hypothetical protein
MEWGGRVLFVGFAFLMVVVGMAMIGVLANDRGNAERSQNMPSLPRTGIKDFDELLRLAQTQKSSPTTEPILSIPEYGPTRNGQGATESGFLTTSKASPWLTSSPVGPKTAPVVQIPASGLKTMPLFQAAPSGNPAYPQVRIGPVQDMKALAEPQILVGPKTMTAFQMPQGAAATMPGIQVSPIASKAAPASQVPPAGPKARPNIMVQQVGPIGGDQTSPGLYDPIRLTTQPRR